VCSIVASMTDCVRNVNPTVTPISHDFLLLKTHHVSRTIAASRKTVRHPRFISILWVL